MPVRRKKILNDKIKCNYFSIFLSPCPSVSLSIYLSINQSIYLSIYLPFSLSLSFCLSLSFSLSHNSLSLPHNSLSLILSPSLCLSLLVPLPLNLSQSQSLLPLSNQSFFTASPVAISIVHRVSKSVTRRVKIRENKKRKNSEYGWVRGKNSDIK